MSATNQLIVGCDWKKIGNISGSSINYGLASNKIANDRICSFGPVNAGTYTEAFGISSGQGSTGDGAYTMVSPAINDVKLPALAQAWSSFSSGAASVLTRLAQGNMAWVQAASVTVNYVLNVSEFLALRTTAGKGIKITSFDLIYLPITASLTSITPTLIQSTYANNVAFAAVTTGAGLGITVGTNTLTVPSTGPWVFTQTVTTPAYFNPSGDQALYLEVQIVTPATAVPNFYGVYLNVTETLL